MARLKVAVEMGPDVRGATGVLVAAEQTLLRLRPHLPSLGCDGAPLQLGPMQVLELHGAPVRAGAGGSTLRFRSSHCVAAVG